MIPTGIPKATFLPITVRKIPEALRFTIHTLPLTTPDRTGEAMNVGGEESIGKNEMIYSMNDNSQIVLDYVHKGDINRYGFVYSDRSEMIELIKLLSIESKLSVYWLLCWEALGYHPSKIKPILLKRKRERDRWSVCQKGPVLLALKKIAMPEFDSFSPDGVTRDDGHLLILSPYGNTPDGNAFKVERESTRKVLYNFTGMGTMAPDRYIYEFLEKNNISILYEINDDQCRQGHVLVGSHKIGDDLLKKCNFIENVSRGKNASSIWL